jgi:hypothetical protein
MNNHYNTVYYYYYSNTFKQSLHTFRITHYIIHTLHGHTCLRQANAGNIMSETREMLSRVSILVPNCQQRMPIY